MLSDAQMLWVQKCSYVSGLMLRGKVWCMFERLSAVQKSSTICWSQPCHPQLYSHNHLLLLSHWAWTLVAKAISTGTSGSTSRNPGKTMFPVPGTVFPVTDPVDPPLQPSISAAHDSDAASSDTEYLPAKRGRERASRGRGHGQVDDQTSAMASRGK